MLWLVGSVCMCRMVGGWRVIRCKVVHIIGELEMVVIGSEGG